MINHNAEYSLRIFIEKCLSNENFGDISGFKSNDSVYFPEFKLNGRIIFSCNFFQVVCNLSNVQKLFKKFFFGPNVDLYDEYVDIKIDGIITNDLLMFYVDPKYIEKK